MKQTLYMVALAALMLTPMAQALAPEALLLQADPIEFSTSIQMQENRCIGNVDTECYFCSDDGDLNGEEWSNCGDEGMGDYHWIACDLWVNTGTAQTSGRCIKGGTFDALADLLANLAQSDSA